MSHDVLRDLFQYVDFTDEVEIVSWTAVLVGFTLVLRVYILVQMPEKL